MPLSAGDLARVQEGDEVEVIGAGGDRRQLVVVSKGQWREDEISQKLGFFPADEVTWLGKDANEPGSRPLRFPVRNVQRLISWWH